MIMEEDQTTETGNKYKKGRGAQINTQNKFLKNQQVRDHIEGIDDWTEKNESTQYFEDHAKGIVNKVESPVII